MGNRVNSRRALISPHGRIFRDLIEIAGCRGPEQEHLQVLVVGIECGSINPEAFIESAFEADLVIDDGLLVIRDHCVRRIEGFVLESAGLVPLRDQAIDHMIIADGIRQ